MAPNYDIATRAQVVVLKACGFKNHETTSKTGVPDRTIRRIYATAIERGFNPDDNLSIVKNEHVAEAPRSGRPIKQTKENKQEIQSKIRRDRYRREKTCAQIAEEMKNISAMTV